MSDAPEKDALTDANALRTAAILMRDQHGPEHERHEMWGAMSGLLFMAADHARGRGHACDSCVVKAVEVARTYLAATRVLPPASGRAESDPHATHGRVSTVQTADGDSA